MGTAWWNASDASPSRAPSRFILAGNPQTFQSLPPTTLPEHAAEHLNPLLSSFTQKHASVQSEAWNRVAHHVAHRRQLRVAILGCSTSVGCGSADPSPMCDASRAWPRLFHDSVQASLSELPGWTYGTQTRVHAKKAESLLETNSVILITPSFRGLRGSACTNTRRTDP